MVLTKLTDMLTPAKKVKMLSELKAYKKKYIDRNTELDESGTRLMVNSFLSDVLGFVPIEEIKTEYMIKGTYADYMIQTGGIRHFLVEVKALSLELSDKHLRQTINYGANEGIEWALLTNGRSFDFYKILFNQPIESRKIFSINLSDGTQLKHQIEFLQYLHKEAIAKKSLKLLWNKCEALFPMSILSLIYSREVTSLIRKLIKSKYGEKCEDDEVLKTLNRIVSEKFDPTLIKPFRAGRADKKITKKTKLPEAVVAPTNLPTENQVEISTPVLN
jgi:hypothetical protein